MRYLAAAQRLGGLSANGSAGRLAAVPRLLPPACLAAGIALALASAGGGEAATPTATATPTPTQGVLADAGPARPQTPGRAAAQTSPTVTPAP